MRDAAECPRCGEDFFWFREYVPSRPATPRRLFGLLAAVPERAPQWKYDCAECGFVWRTPFTRCDE